MFSVLLQAIIPEVTEWDPNASGVKNDTVNPNLFRLVRVLFLPFLTPDPLRLVLVLERLMPEWVFSLKLTRPPAMPWFIYALWLRRTNIRVCQLHNDMDIFYPKINCKKQPHFFFCMIATLTDLGTEPSAGGVCAVLFQDTTPPEFMRRVSTACWIMNAGSHIDEIQWATVTVTNWR